MDSDDEDDDETEDALKKHTLLSIYYIAHPQPEEEVKRKADLSIAPPPITGGETGGTNNKEPLPASLYTASGSFGEPAKNNNNAEDSAADAKGKNFGSPQEDENKNAIEEIMTKLQKNIGEVPTFDVVLTAQMLYFFHDMRYHFSLNLTRCGDKPAFRRAKAIEKLEVSKLVAKILKEQQKNSVFYLDSSDESEGEASPGGEDEGSDHEEDDGRSVASVSVNNPRGALARALSTASMNGTAPSTLNPTASPGPSAVPPPLSKTKSSVGRNPRSRPVKSIDAAAPPASSFSDKNSTDKVVMMKTKGGKILPESKAPPNYPITAWAIQLVSFDK